MLARLASLAVGPLLGLSELVTIETLRLLGTVIAAAASIYAATSARRGMRDARELKRDVRRRRRSVRVADTEHVLVVDEPHPELDRLADADELDGDGPR